MTKPKRHYEVYYVGKGSGCYAEDYQRTYLGDVWAVSEKQAKHKCQKDIKKWF